MNETALIPPYMYEKVEWWTEKEYVIHTESNIVWIYYKV